MSTQQHVENGLPVLPQLPLKVCSLQVPSEGTRKFVSASVPEMWRRLVQLAPASRHFYEILREDTPLHLYFDIEFSYDSNPTLDGDALVFNLLQWVSTHMKDCFGQNGEFDARHLVDLDSTTTRKFSRHVIVRLPSGCVFRSGAHAGSFVLSLVRRLQRWRALDEDVEALWVAPPPTPPEDPATGPFKATVLPMTQHSSSTHSGTAALPLPPPKEFIADLAVYTKNRAMRQYLSTKPGRNAPLLPTQSDAAVLPIDGTVEHSSTGQLQPPLAEWWWGAPGTSPTFVAETHASKVHALDLQGSGSTSAARRLVGDTAWERDLWRYCFIADVRPPLFLAKGFYQGCGMLRASAEDFDVPCCPVSQAPLLYMAPPKHPFCICKSATQRTDEDKERPHSTANVGATSRSDAVASGHGLGRGCSHFRVCAEAWRPADGMGVGSNGVLQASRTAQGGCIHGAPSVHGADQPFVPSQVPAGSPVHGQHLPRRTGGSAESFLHQSLLRAICEQAESVHTVPAGVRSWSLQERAVVFEKLAPCSGEARFVCRLVAERATLNMQNNRFCHRIGRAHRSNNVNYVIDFSAQVVRQTCMDWECRQVRFCSDPLPIPASAFPDQTPGPDFVLRPHIDPGTVAQKKIQ